MIELIVFLIVAGVILAIVYLADPESYLGDCPDCRHKLIRWTEERFDCSNCGYKKYS
jgi:hypothetical protein